MTITKEFVGTLLLFFQALKEKYDSYDDDLELDYNNKRGIMYMIEALKNIHISGFLFGVPLTIVEDEPKQHIDKEFTDKVAELLDEIADLYDFYNDSDTTYHIEDMVDEFALAFVSNKIMNVPLHVLEKGRISHSNKIANEEIANKEAIDMYQNLIHTSLLAIDVLEEEIRKKKDAIQRQIFSYHHSIREHELKLAELKGQQK